MLASDPMLQPCDKQFALSNQIVQYTAHYTAHYTLTRATLPFLCKSDREKVKETLKEKYQNVFSDTLGTIFAFKAKFNVSSNAQPFLNLIQLGISAM